jgi:hypothetical protein
VVPQSQAVILDPRSFLRGQKCLLQDGVTPLNLDGEDTVGRR